MLTNTLDGLGYRTTVGYDPVGRPRSLTDARGFVTTANYDPAGRLRSLQDALGYFTTLSYDAASRPTTFQNARACVTTLVYDIADRLIASVNPLGYFTTQSYDVADRPTTFQNALGSVTTFEYDGFARLVGTQDPLGNRSTFLYDKVDNLLLATDPKGQVTTSTYSARKERLTSLFMDATRTTYSYDPTGSLLTAQDATGRHTTTYDERDLLATVQGPNHRNNAPLTYAYDAVGNRQTLDYWWGRFTYLYDNNDQLRSVCDPGRTDKGLPAGFTTYTYDERSQVTRQDNTDGTRTTTSYDALGRAFQIRHSTAANVEIARAFSTYDELSRPQVVDGVGGRYTYGYDNLDQLTSEHNPVNGLSTYTYDPANRRKTLALGSSVTTYTYDTADQLAFRQTGASFTTYTYDANGNTTRVQSASGTTTSYSWDASDRLSVVALPNGNRYTQTYRYDHLRSSQRGDSQFAPGALETNVLVWDGLEALSWRNTGNGHEQDFVQGAQGLARVVGSRNGGVNVGRVYLSDALDSTQVATDGGHRLTYTYDAWGNVLNELTIRYQYNPAAYVGGWGYWYEPQLGLYYVRARWYDPQTGRWLSRDPIGFDGGDWNLYRYVENAPTWYVDSSGMEAQLQPKPGGPNLRVDIYKPPIPWWLSVARWAGGLVSGPIAGVGTVAAGVGLLVCPQPAGPKPKPEQSCEQQEKYRGYPKFGDVYNPPDWPKFFRGANCEDAINSAAAAVKKHFPNQKLRRIPADEVTGGPCPDIAKHVVLQAPGRKNAPGGKKATVVCCPTCDDLPEILIAEEACKCGVLDRWRNKWAP